MQLNQDNVKEGMVDEIKSDFEDICITKTEKKLGETSRNGNAYFEGK